jgi:hypothetical protein
MRSGRRTRRASPSRCRCCWLAVDFGSAELSLPQPAYFGIPPQEASRIGLREMPRYVLTIENYASFHRHIAETDRDASG